MKIPKPPTAQPTTELQAYFNERGMESLDHIAIWEMMEFGKAKGAENYRKYKKIPKKLLISLGKTTEMVESPQEYADVGIEMGYSTIGWIAGWRKIECQSCGEVATPYFQGGSRNPAVMYQNTTAGAMRQARKIQAIPRGFKILKIVLTFPKPISLAYLENPDAVKKQADKALKQFLDMAYGFIGKGRGKMGALVHFHVWKTSNPTTEPHLHYHIMIPLFTLGRMPTAKNRKLGLKLTQDLQKRLDKARHELEAFTASEDASLYPQKRTALQEHIRNLEFHIDQRMLDWWKFKHTEPVNKPGIPYKVPVDVIDLKGSWYSALKDAFPKAEIPEDAYRLNIHLKSFSKLNKARLLHALKYDSRPPTLDLASYLKKGKPLENRDWAKHLFTLENRGVTYGIWRFIKNLASINETDLEAGEVCPICGGRYVQYRGMQAFLQTDEVYNVFVEADDGLRFFVWKPPDKREEGGERDKSRYLEEWL